MDCGVVIPNGHLMEAKRTMTGTRSVTSMLRLAWVNPPQAPLALTLAVRLVNQTSLALPTQGPRFRHGSAARKEKELA